MKIALLTIFDENIRAVAERTVPTMRRYADQFDLEFIIRPPDSGARKATWGKILRIRDVLRSGFDYCFYVDADAMFVRFDEDIRDHIQADKDLYLCWHGPEETESYAPLTGHFNAGVMVWRNSAWSLNFLDELLRHRHIGHPWEDQAALLELLGYHQALGMGDDNLDMDRNAHVQKLPLNWNVLAGLVVAPDPIISHFAGRTNDDRLMAIAIESGFQATRELLPPEGRHHLLRHLNQMSFYRGQSDNYEDAQREAAEAVFDRDHLLRSRSRLAKAFWAAVIRKLVSRG
jgi:hypothetical protein